MKQITFGPVLLSTALMLGLSACTPSKEDPPPQPKVSADVTPATVDATAGTSSAAVARRTESSGDNEDRNTNAASSQLTALPVLGMAPEWQLKDLNGKTVSSDELKGKVVVVDFWATWCGPCRQEIPGYTEMQKKYGKEGFTMVGVSLDQAGVDVVQSFVSKYGVNYPIVMGDETIVAAFGGIEAIPTTFLIDRTGKIRDRKVGAEATEEYEKKVLAVLKES